MLALPLLVMPICAAEAESETELCETYSADEFGAYGILDELSSDELARLPEGDIYSSDGAVSGFDASYFFKLIGDAVAAAMRPALKTFASVLALIIAASLLSMAKDMFTSGTVNTVFELMSGLCILLTLYSSVVGMTETVREYLTRLAALVGASVPVTAAISVTGGSITAATVSSNGMMLGLAIVEILASEVLFPIIQLCFGLCVASGIGGPLKLGGISKTVRGAVTFIFALIGAVISAVMTFQTSIASKADGLSMRAIKFAASHSIPVVGGIAGDAVGTVAESLSLVKCTVGWVGVILIIIITVPVITEVLLMRFGLVLSQTAAEIVGLEREKSLIAEVCGLMGFLAAVCVIAAIMFVYAMALFANTATALM